MASKAINASHALGPDSVMRHDGSIRLTAEWNRIQKDPELWLTSGSCLVYLYAEGQSRKEPSFLVPSDCFDGTTLEELRNSIDIEERQLLDTINSYLNKEYLAAASNDIMKDIYLPAPVDLSNEATYDWHITTRNYLAFCCRKPMVGTSLGQAFIALYERLKLWRPRHAKNQEDLVAYAQDMGYCNFPHCSDYALAMLQFADAVHMESLWVDAFAHCCGMYELLHMSNEYKNTSPAVISALDKAASTMSQRIEDMTLSINNFAKDDLIQLRLSHNAIAHVEDFRQSLLAFFTQKYGFWPPSRRFSKSILTSMRSDFQILYSFLADQRSSMSKSRQQLVAGGINVVQIVHEFDTGRNVEHMAHPHPLLPRNSSDKVATTQKALSALRIGQKSLVTGREGLAAAVNKVAEAVLHSPIIKHYQKYEQDLTNDKVHKLSLSDGRKARWILIYCMLQLLSSILNAPEQVRDKDTPKYFLCCDTSRLPSWRPILIKRRADSKPQPVLPKALVTPPSTSSSTPKTQTDDDLISTSIKPHRTATAPDFEDDVYHRHKEVASPSWKSRFSTREPSALAIEELRKQSGVTKKTKDTKSRNKGSISFPANASQAGLVSGKKASPVQALQGQLVRRDSTSTGISSHSAQGSLSATARHDTPEYTAVNSPVSANSTLPGSRASSSSREFRTPDTETSGAVPITQNSLHKPARSSAAVPSELRDLLAAAPPASNQQLFKMSSDIPRTTVRSSHSRGFSEIITSSSKFRTSSRKKSTDIDRVSGGTKGRSSSVSGTLVLRNLPVK